MVVRVNARYAVLLGRDAQYPAPVAFTLAHELGHIAVGHIQDGTTIIDLDDPITAQDAQDAEEQAADQFALSLLTGSPEPTINTNVAAFGALQLANAALAEGPRIGIEPGTLALCYAYRTDQWAKAIGSLRHIYSQAKPVWNEVNQVASQQLNWQALPDDSADFLRNILGLADG
jgi:hypothetical protein